MLFARFRVNLQSYGYLLIVSELNEYSETF